MASIGFVEAFAHFDAKLVNKNWAVSALAKDGALVLSCWTQYFGTLNGGVLRYTDRLSRWTGNDAGRNLLAEHLKTAFSEERIVRMVVATAKNPTLVEKVSDASKIRKTFHVRDDVVGRLTEFDGDNFVIAFARP